MIFIAGAIIITIIAMLLVRPGTFALPAAPTACTDCGDEAAASMHYNGDPICPDCGADRWMRSQR